MIVVKDLFKNFDKNKVLKGLNLRIEDGECIGLIGPSGSGKSVFLKCLGQIYKVDGGQISSGLEPIEISSMFQEGALFDSVSALDNVVFPLVEGRVPFTRSDDSKKKEIEDMALSVLGKVGLSKAIRKLPGQLSGGMRKRLSLARALVNNPKMALLDDPTSGLDPIASSVIMELIRSIHDTSNMITVIASHDLRRLFPYVDRIIALFDGEIIFDGNLDILKEKQNKTLSNFVSARYEL
jgi:phospholipid/cholesterol/gamma-HCH transport system ATP-binding protein